MAAWLVLALCISTQILESINFYQKAQLCCDLNWDCCELILKGFVFTILNISIQECGRYISTYLNLLKVSQLSFIVFSMEGLRIFILCMARCLIILVCRDIQLIFVF